MAQFTLVAGIAANVFVALVFLVAAIDKLRHRALLPGVIGNYRLLPEALVAPVAGLLPIVELAVGAALMLGIGAAATVPAMLLLLLFALAMAINIRRGRRHIDCGCGQSGLRQNLGWGLVLRNLSMVGALGVALTSGFLTGLAPGVVEFGIGFVSGVLAFLLLQTFTVLNALPGRRLDGARG